MASRAIQPMTTYSTMLSFLKRSRSMMLQVMPMRAQAEIMAKSGMPTESRRATSVIGAYVPAMRRKMEQWSNTRSTFFSRLSRTAW